MSALVQTSSSARVEAWCWLAQRASAAILGFCVVVHLATIILAVRGGLTAAEILGRTRGSAAWAAFYALFVLAVAIHAPLGLRAILAEWAGWSGRAVDAMLVAFALLLVAGGMTAIRGVVGLP
jgi:fumarate reductase subunit C